MKKNIYIVKSDDQTFPYLEESLKTIEVKVGETTDDKGKSIDQMDVLDSREKIEKFMPDGKWVEAELLNDVLGKHEAKLQRTLAEPNEELAEDYFEVEEAKRREWLAERRAERVDSIVVSIVCTKYDGNELEEKDVDELPVRVKDLLVGLCNKRFGGNHEAFLQSVWRRRDN